MSILQNTIAIVYDCDMTLTPRYMQEPLFRKYGVEERVFWAEKDEMRRRARDQGISFDDECAYTNLILRYVKGGKFANLSNDQLRRLGAEIELFPGLPDFFDRVRKIPKDDETFKAHQIIVEHYVASSGLKAMIEGSALGPHLDGIFASEFVEGKNGEIAELARVVGFLKKTEFLYELNKGCNKDPTIDINRLLPAELRRVPWQNMIYVGDGPTDVPCFSLVNKNGGTTFAVYAPGSLKAFGQAYSLAQQKRVLAFAPADYQEGSQISLCLEQTVRRLAERIVKAREMELERGGSPAPKYLL